MREERLDRSGRQRIAAPTPTGPSSANCADPWRALTPYDAARKLPRKLHRERVFARSAFEHVSIEAHEGAPTAGKSDLEACGRQR